MPGDPMNSDLDKGHRVLDQADLWFPSRKTFFYNFVSPKDLRKYHSVVNYYSFRKKH